MIAYKKTATLLRIAGLSFFLFCCFSKRLAQETFARHPPLIPAPVG